MLQENDGITFDEKNMCNIPEKDRLGSRASIKT